MVTRPFPPKVLSPIEKPFVFASPVHPSSGQRINQPLAPRLVPGATPMRPQLVMGGRPITSVTPVRPSKPHSSPPTTAVRKPMPTQAISSGTSVKAIPIASSPAVNIITPASIMAHLAASKVAIGNPAVPISVTRPFSVSSAAVPISVQVTRPVAISNPVLPMSVTQPVAVSNPALPISVTRSVAIRNQAVPISVTPVAISNPLPSQSISNPVSTIPSVAIASLSANRSVMSNIPAGVIPLTKIRPAYQVSIMVCHCCFKIYWLPGTTTSYIEKETKPSATTKATTPIHSKASHTSTLDCKGIISSPSTKTAPNAEGTHCKIDRISSAESSTKAT